MSAKLRRPIIWTWTILSILVLALSVSVAWAETRTIQLATGRQSECYTDSDNVTERHSATTVDYQVFVYNPDTGVYSWQYVSNYAPIAITHGSWGAPVPDSRWINFQRNIDNGTPGPSKYRNTFWLPPGAANVSLGFQVLADDWVEIVLNGNIIFRTFTDNEQYSSQNQVYFPNCNGNYNVAFFSCAQNLSMANGLLTNTQFVTGENTIQYDVWGPDYCSGLASLATISYDYSGPVAVPGGPYRAAAGIPFQLDGSASYHSGGGSIKRYYWDTDGDPSTWEVINTTGLATATVNEIGGKILHLKVTDPNGNYSIDQAVVSVVGSPTATINSPPADITVFYGEQIYFSGNSALGYTYKWETTVNGQTYLLSNESSFFSTTLPIGVNTVTYTITDPWSRSNSANRTVQVLSNVDRVDLAIEAGDITFWQNGEEVTNPAAGSEVKVRVRIHNLSHNESPPACVNFGDAYFNGGGDPIYDYACTEAPIPPYGFADATLNWLTNPEKPGYHIIYANVWQVPTENYSNNNYAGHFIMLAGGTTPSGTLVIADNTAFVPGVVDPGSSFDIAVYSYYRYDEGAISTWMTAVQGSQVTVEFNGQTYSKVTDGGGYFAQRLTAPITPGIYDITVTVTDSTLTGIYRYQVRVNAPPDPDLLVTDIWLTTAVRNSAEIVNAQICNTGLAFDFATKAQLEIRDLSGDEQPVTDPITVNVPPFGYRECKTVQFSGWSPTDEGYFKFKVTANYPDPVAGEPTANNSLEKTLRIYDDAPDLQPVELAKVCDTIRVRIINNDGLPNSDGDVQLFIDNQADPLLTVGIQQTIPAKGAAYPQIWVDLDASSVGDGLHQVKVVITNVTGERKTGNNFITGTFDFTNLADAAVVDLSVDGQIYRPNIAALTVPAVLDAYVKNTGCTALSNISVNFVFNGTVLDTKVIPSLAIGQTADLHLDKTFTNPPYPAATYQFMAEVLMTDSAPGNDARTENLTVTPAPMNLEVLSSGITFPLASTNPHPNPNEPFNIRVQVCNRGSQPAQRFQASFYEEGVAQIGYTYTWDLSAEGGLAPEQCKEIWPSYYGWETTWTIAEPGTSYIMVLVSPVAGDQDDTDDGNNSATRAISINQAPVAVISVTGEKTYYLPGETIQFDASASNDALDQDGLGRVESYSWYFSDGFTSTEIAATHAFASSGDWTVSLTVTDNNGATSATVNKTISVRRPDLSVPSVVNPPSATPGQSINVSAVVKNAVGPNAPASTVGFYLSSDTALGNDTPLGQASVPELSSDAQYTAAISVTIPSGTANGSWYILAQADNGALVDEESESNNINVNPISIGPPVYTVLTVIQPNGGEVINAGSVYTIKWGTPNTGYKFTLSYSKDGGSTWTTIGSVTGATSYNWQTNAADNSTNCKVKVAEYSGKVLKGTDVSDNIFTLKGTPPAVTLDAPNGGESLYSGTSFTIRWTTGTTSTVTMTNLQYTLDGRNWSLIAEPAGNPGTYNWTVPTVSRSITKCKVKVTLYNGGTSVGTDSSNANFTINP